MPIAYDREDFGMTARDLKAKYPYGHPEYSLDEWSDRLTNQNAYKDYWHWVVEMIREDSDPITSDLQMESYEEDSYDWP